MMMMNECIFFILEFVSEVYCTHEKDSTNRLEVYIVFGSFSSLVGDVTDESKKIIID